jgi:hypothetical protein
MVHSAVATTARDMSSPMATGAMGPLTHIPPSYVPQDDAAVAGCFNAAHNDAVNDPTPTQAELQTTAYVQATSGTPGGLSEGFAVQAAYGHGDDARTGQKKDGAMQSALDQSLKMLNDRLEELDRQVAGLIQEIEDLEDENRTLDRIQNALQGGNPEDIQAALNSDPEAKAKIESEFQKRQGRKADMNDPADMAILHAITEDFEDENIQKIADKVKSVGEIQEEQAEIAKIKKLPEVEIPEAAKSLSFASQVQVANSAGAASTRDVTLKNAGIESDDVNEADDNLEEKVSSEQQVAMNLNPGLSSISF